MSVTSVRDARTAFCKRERNSRVSDVCVGRPVRARKKREIWRDDATSGSEAKRTTRTDTTVAGPFNLSTPEPDGGDESIGTAHTITDLLESQMVDLLRTPPSEGSDSAGQEC
ncbi:hypothetical protein Trydic_g15238 [Trypoxylus dichotomus]